MKGFRDRIVSGSVWMLAVGVLRNVLDLAVNLVLIRWLVPADFGLVAMAMSAAGFAALFSQMGLGSALVQLREIQEKHLSTVFWAGLGIGLLVCSVIAGSARGIAWFYGEVELTLILVILSTQFIVASLAVVPRAMLRRELRFRELAKVDATASVLSGTTALVLAFSGAGVWALIIRAIILQAVKTTYIWWLGKWRPSFIFDRGVVRQVMKFSGPYYLTDTLKFLSRNLDSVLIGKFVGSSHLGIYNRAYSLMLMPSRTLTMPIRRVLISAFSAIQDDHEQIRRIYLRFSGAVALVAVPGMVGVAIVAEPLVTGAFGADWAEMVSILRVLALAATCQTVLGLHASIFLSQGRTDLQLRYTLIGRALVMVGIVAGMNWGIYGVAIGVALGMTADLVLGMHQAGKLIGLTLLALLNHLKGVLLATVAMSGVVIALDQVGFLVGLPALARLGVLSGAGAGVYSLVVLVSRPRPYEDLRKVVQERLRRKG